MKSLKKTIMIFLLLVLAITIFTACGSDSENSDEIILTDTEAVIADKTALTIIYTGSDNSSRVKQNVTLVLSGNNRTIISWSSDTTEVIENNGKVIRPAYDSCNETVILTATITKGIKNETKNFTLTVIKINHFITTWKTNNIGFSNDNQIKLPLDSDGNYDFNVDWGDGNSNYITSYNQAEATHTYTSIGTYNIEIIGAINGFGFKATDEDNQKLLDIKEWGDVQLHNKGYQFDSTVITIFSASDTPDLSSITNMNSMFALTDTFNGNINSWDVSNVTNMSLMFRGADAFNQDISSWNVSNVTNMGAMFYQTNAFNQNLSSWDVSNVTNMHAMFSATNSFNGNINSWDVSNVTNMNDMFLAASAFNQDISSWNVSSVIDMSLMFFQANAFNQNLNLWDVSSVTNMRCMFASTELFNGNISSWDVSNVTNMNSMFEGTDAFNQDLESWVVGIDTWKTDMFRNSLLEGSEPSWY